MSNNVVVFLFCAVFVHYGGLYLHAHWNSDDIKRLRETIKISWTKFWTPRKRAGLIALLVLACSAAIWILTFLKPSLKFSFANTGLHWYPTIFLDAVVSVLTLWANIKVNYGHNIDRWMTISLFIASVITFVKLGHVLLTIVGQYVPDLTNFVTVVCASPATLIPYLKGKFDPEAKDIDDAVSATRTVLMARRALPRLVAAGKQAEVMLNKLDQSQVHLESPASTSFDRWVAINILRKRGDAHRVLDALKDEQRINEAAGYVQIIRDQETQAKSILKCEDSVQSIVAFSKEEVRKRLNL